MRERIEKLIEYIEFHKAKNKHYAFMTQDSRKRQKLMAGATFINEIQVELKEILILSGADEKCVK